MADAAPRRRKDRLREVTRQRENIKRQITEKRARLSTLTERAREHAPPEPAERKALLDELTALNEEIDALVAEREVLTTRASAIR